MFEAEGMMTSKKGAQSRDQDIIQKMIGKRLRIIRRKRSPVEVIIRQNGKNYLRNSRVIHIRLMTRKVGVVLLKIKLNINL